MGKRSYFYGALTIAWVFLGIFLSDRIFGKDQLAEVITVICCASIGIFISFAMEYVLLRLKKFRDDLK